MSKNIIIDEAGLPKALTVDALRTSKQGGGSEDWAFASETGSGFVKMSVGKNVEVNASDYGAQAITEVDVTQAIYDIKTQEDKSSSEPQVVSIKEDNTPRYFSQVKKLRVRQQSDSMVSLIPNIVTGTLYATKRGHYVAKNDGYEGYSKVYVDVPESSDGTGEDGGWTDLPYSIRVTTPPRKIIYTHGDTINYSGIIVHAYDSKGQDLGVVPFNELLFPIEIVDASIEHNYNTAESNFDISPIPNPCPYQEGQFENTYVWTDNYGYMHEITIDFTSPEGKLLRVFGFHYDDSQDQLCAFFASNDYDAKFTTHLQQVNLTTGQIEAQKTYYQGTSDPTKYYRYDGKVAYYKSFYGDPGYPFGYRGEGTSIGVPDIYWPWNTGDMGKIAWTLIYGDIIPGGYIIPVQWQRYRDGIVLETSFDIQVV